MNRQANVQSIDSLCRFRAAIQEYLEVLQEILSNLQLESQRTVDWVQYDRTAYWRTEARSSSDTLQQALTVLEMKQLTISGGDHPACTEARQRVQKARQRLHYAEKQVARARQLVPQLQHHADEYQGVLGKVAQLIDADLPSAMATLDRIIQSLSQYALTREPTANVSRLHENDISDSTEGPPQPTDSCATQSRQTPGPPTRGAQP